MASLREEGATSGSRPHRMRMLRIEYKGQPYDWFDLDEMGDIVRTGDFSTTIRENIAHYFGVPYDCQAVYDEEGMLSTVSDFARALRSGRPWLKVYNTREMAPELKERTIQQLHSIILEVTKSLELLDGTNAQQQRLSPGPGVRDPSLSLADAVKSANDERAGGSRPGVFGTGTTVYGSASNGALGSAQRLPASFGPPGGAALIPPSLHVAPPLATANGSGTPSAPLGGALGGALGTAGSSTPPRYASPSAGYATSLGTQQPVATDFLDSRRLGSSETMQPPASWGAPTLAGVGGSTGARGLGSGLPGLLGSSLPSLGVAPTAPAAPAVWGAPAQPWPVPSGTLGPSLGAAARTSSPGAAAGVRVARAGSPLRQVAPAPSVDNLGRPPFSGASPLVVLPTDMLVPQPKQDYSVNTSTDEAYDVVEIVLAKEPTAPGEKPQRFGFANIPTRDGRSLLVSWVDDNGLLARFNKAHPEKAIVEGDRIVSVNQAADDIEAMRSELQTDSIRMIVHRRSSTTC